MRTAIEIAAAVRSGECTAVEVVEECLGAIEASNAKLNAFVVVDGEAARRTAAEIDAKVARGLDPGPFAGVPFGVKDLSDAAGLPTSHGSLLYKGRPPVTSDDVDVARLRAAGAVVVGKTAAPEFGSVCFTSTRAWGTTRNPWNREMTPGGSSGGSAAAVAAGMVPMATASDGGGSTRIPAAFSGLFGMKASFGRIPFPNGGASQTSVKGILTTTVADSARHLDVCAGPDDRDRVSLPRGSHGSYESVIDSLPVAGLRIGWSLDLGFAVVDPEVAELAHAAALELCDACGVELVEVDVRITDPIRSWLGANVLDLYQDLEPGMWPDRADELERNNRWSLEQCDKASPAQMARIWQRRMRLEQEVAAVHEQVDVLLTPATAVPAFAAEGPLPNTINGEAVHPAMVVPFTMVANLCWNPASSVPAGLTASGLPVGLQIQGSRHADDVVLRLSRIFEQARPWPRLAPGYGGASSAASGAAGSAHPGEVG